MAAIKTKVCSPCHCFLHFLLPIHFFILHSHKGERLPYLQGSMYFSNGLLPYFQQVAEFKGEWSPYFHIRVEFVEEHGDRTILSRDCIIGAPL